MNAKKRRTSKDRMGGKDKRRARRDPEAAVSAQWDFIDDGSDRAISSVVAGFSMRSRLKREFRDLFQAGLFTGLLIVKVLFVYQVAMVAAAWNSQKACKRTNFRLERIYPAARVACYLTGKFHEPRSKGRRQ